MIMCPVGKENELKYRKKHKVQFRIFVPAVLIPLFVGGFSAFLTREDMGIYNMADKPFLAPPDWVFPIAWTILYIMMGTASYLVYVTEADVSIKRKALILYGAQLAMNFFWSILFFTYSRYLMALIWLLLMWVLILMCCIRFYRILPLAGLMMGVLLLWTCFAAYLNLACYIMSITPMPIK